MLESFRLKLASVIAPELIEQRDTARRAANSDPLTGIANRRAFDLARATFEDDPSTCVILFDVNNFGQVNKRAGHDAGDRLLVSIARNLAAIAARYGLSARVFRIGGDEFAILAPCRFAVAIRDRCERGARDIGGTLITISGSVGSNLTDADRELQARKVARKASGA
jgi:diguanylate cyclase (GGDEF)-like protein